MTTWERASELLLAARLAFREGRAKDAAALARQAALIVASS